MVILKRLNLPNNTINRILDFLVILTFAYTTETMPYQKANNISNETIDHGVEN